MIITIVSDLIFSSKIKTVVNARNLELKIIKSEEDLIKTIEEKLPKQFIVDLHAIKIDPNLAIKIYKSKIKEGKVIAFYSHVDVELAKQAELNGADIVLPRSQFVKDLANLIND